MEMVPTYTYIHTYTELKREKNRLRDEGGNNATVISRILRCRLNENILYEQSNQYTCK